MNSSLQKSFLKKFHPLLAADEHTLNGSIRIAGTRVSVHLVLRMLADGNTIAEILQSYPSLTREAVLACINFAADQMERNEGYSHAA